MKTIRLTEAEFHNLVKEATLEVIREGKGWDFLKDAGKHIISKVCQQSGVKSPVRDPWYGENWGQREKDQAAYLDQAVGEDGVTLKPEYQEHVKNIRAKNQPTKPSSGAGDTTTPSPSSGEAS